MPCSRSSRRILLLLPLACGLIGCGGGGGDLKEGVPADAAEQSAKAQAEFQKQQEQIGNDMMKGAH